MTSSNGIVMARQERSFQCFIVRNVDQIALQWETRFRLYGIRRQTTTDVERQIINIVEHVNDAGRHLVLRCCDINAVT